MNTPRPKFGGTADEFMGLSRAWREDAKQAAQRGDAKRAHYSYQVADRFTAKAHRVRQNQPADDGRFWMPDPFVGEDAPEDRG